jgi:hypothetical protein
LSKVQLETTRLRKYQPADGPVLDFDDSMPLETRVESLPIAVEAGGHELAHDIRLLAGRHWAKLVKPLAASAPQQFITRYPIHVPDAFDPADAPTCAHIEAWSSFAAVAGRRIDGIKLYRYLKHGAPHRASDGIAALVGLESQADALAERFITWFERLIHQPPADEPAAWLPDRLEYRFACAAPEAAGEKVFVADEYSQGHLDWYNFEMDPARRALGEPAAMPAPPSTTAVSGQAPSRATRGCPVTPDSPVSPLLDLGQQLRTQLHLEAHAHVELPHAAVTATRHAHHASGNHGAVLAAEALEAGIADVKLCGIRLNVAQTGPAARRGFTRVAGQEPGEGSKELFHGGEAGVAVARGGTGEPGVEAARHAGNAGRDDVGIGADGAQKQLQRGGVER